MIAGQRHLGGADQVEVVGLEPVHLLGVRAEEPGARHHLRAHQHRRDHQRETVLRGQLHRELQQAQLQQRAARRSGSRTASRTPWRRAPCRSGPATRRVRGGPSGSRWPRGSPTVSSTTKSSSPPAGTPSMITLEIAMCAAVKAFSASACVGLGGLDLLGQFLGPLEQRGPLLRATPRRPACWPPSARRAGCRRPRPPRAGRRRRPAARRPGPGLRRGRAARRAPVGVLAQQLEVDHGATLLVGAIEQSATAGTTS